MTKYSQDGIIKVFF